MIYFIGILIVFLSGCEKAQDKDQIVVGTCADYPPFEFVHEGKIVGFDIDLANAIARELGLKCEIKDLSFANIFSSLKSNKVTLGISSISATPERAQNFDFSTAYHYDSVVLLVLNESMIKEPCDVKNKKIMAQMGSVGADWLASHGKDVESVLVNNMVTSVQSVLHKRVDGVILDTASAQAMMAQSGDISCKMRMVILEEGGGCMVALAKNSPLTKKVNEVLSRLEASGELAQLKKRWLEK